MPTSSFQPKDKILIRTYGLFWKIKDVYWGRQNHNGNLYGTRAKAKKSVRINFRDQVGLYVLYADFKLVYIGQAGKGNNNLYNRLKQHTKDDLGGRWNQFSWFGLKWVKKDNELSAESRAFHPTVENILNQIEAILIHTCEPQLNRQGGRWGSQTEKFIQYRDEENLGKTEIQLLKEINKKT